MLGGVLLARERTSTVNFRLGSGGFRTSGRRKVRASRVVAVAALLAGVVVLPAAPQGRAEGSSPVRISETRANPRNDYDIGYRPAAAYNEARDEFLVVWTRPEPGAEETGVYGRRVAGNGVPLGNEFRISSDYYVEEFAQAPAVVWNPIRDQYLVVWWQFECLSEACPEDVRNILGRRLRGNGAPIGDEIRIARSYCDFCDGGLTHPDVTFNEDRNLYLVVWGDATGGRPLDFLDGIDGVWGRHIRPNGNAVGEAFVVADPLGPDADVAVAYNAARRLYQIVWSNEFGGGAARVLGQRIRSNEARIGEVFTVAEGGPEGIRSQPDIDFNPDRNEFFVVWSDDRGAGLDVYGQRVSSYSRLRGDPQRLSGSVGDEMNPAVRYQPVGERYLVAWDNTNEATPGVKGRLADHRGRPIDTAFRLADTSAAEVPALAVVPLTGANLVVWEKDRVVWGRLWP